MISYQLEKAGRRLKKSVKLLNMKNERNQQLASMIEWPVWYAAFRSERIPEEFDRPIHSEDIQEGYLMAAIEFSERHQDRKTDFSNMQTVQNSAILDTVRDNIDYMFEHTSIKEEEMLPLLLTLINSVEFNMEMFGRNGYLVMADRFRSLLDIDEEDEEEDQDE